MAASGSGAFREHRSCVDGSVNHVRPVPGGGLEEARFVRRVRERFIVYLSSMAGCDMACRFCHLTQTGQTSSTRLSAASMLEQARAVLSRGGYEGAETVHFNFMARGEPMACSEVGPGLFAALGEEAAMRGLAARIKVSTIMPRGIGWRTPETLWRDGLPPIDLYYSLYSVDPAWRKRWLPKAMEPAAAMDWLARWQAVTGGRVVLHWALIAGENDGRGDAAACAALARASGLDYGFNLVRYNPANAKSAEAPAAARDGVLEVMAASAARARAIPRVGFDVAASCGMFLGADAA